MLGKCHLKPQWDTATFDLKLKTNKQTSSVGKDIKEMGLSDSSDETVICYKYFRKKQFISFFKS